MTDRVGTEIAGYRIESLIARGGMGEVYLAAQSFPERKVALKLLPHDLASDPAFRERFIRESNAAASLEHPNIVPVYGAGESDGELWIAMRFVDGEDLRSLLEREGPLVPERAALICAQIADALEEAHEHGLVHRDVKPGNILVAKGDRAYLSDFGLIRPVELDTSLTKTGQLMGTIDYVAPEQIKGQAVDGRADIYSLGCVLYECLTVEPPFRRETEVATLYAHLEDTPPVPSATASSAPGGLDEVVMRAMARQPDERFATASELGVAIRASVGPQIAETLWGFPERRRRRWLTTAVVGVAFVAVVAVVAFVTTRGSELPTQPAQRANVALIDPDSLQVIKSLSDGTGGWSAVAGEGALWVATPEGVLRRDESTGRAVKVIDIGQAAHLLASGYESIWLTTAAGASNAVVRINPATNEVTKTVDISPRGGGGPFVGSGLLSVTTGLRAVWVVDFDGTLWKIDPISTRVVGHFPVVQLGSSVTIGAGSVWVADSLNNAVVRVNPDSGDIVKTIDLASAADWIAFAGGQLWIEDFGAATVTPVDPASYALGRPIAVARNPSWMSAGLGSLWVPGESAVTKVDPITLRTEDIPIAFVASSVASDTKQNLIWTIQGWGRGSTLEPRQLHSP